MHAVWELAAGGIHCNFLSAAESRNPQDPDLEYCLFCIIRTGVGAMIRPSIFPRFFAPEKEQPWQKSHCRSCSSSLPTHKINGNKTHEIRNHSGQMQASIHFA